MNSPLRAFNCGAARSINNLHLPPKIDLRLVVSDMDGTLLDEAGKLPTQLDSIAAQMRKQNIIFCPASGRQLSNLQRTLGSVVQDAPIIAENGTLVICDGQEFYRNTLTRTQTLNILRTVNNLSAKGMNVGAVVTTPQLAYVERTDADFLAQVDTYYFNRKIVVNLEALPLDDALKVAVYDFTDAESNSAQFLSRISQVQTVVSSKHWTDLMPVTASKGNALHLLQQHLEITPQQTAVFGDQLNDLEMFKYADFTFAVANAHPKILAAARYTAPANTENGVLQVIKELLKHI